VNLQNLASEIARLLSGERAEQREYELEAGTLEEIGELEVLRFDRDVKIAHRRFLDIDPRSRDVDDPTTWEELVMVEPRLGELLQHIQQIKDDGSKSSFCANVEWYYRTNPSLKLIMTYLVGFHAAHPKLRNMENYGVAYDILFDALPDCRNCMCE
jgi:hypothetical protein